MAALDANSASLAPTAAEWVFDVKASLEIDINMLAGVPELHGHIPGICAGLACNHTALPSLSPQRVDWASARESMPMQHRGFDSSTIITPPRMSVPGLGSGCLLCLYLRQAL
jgi:hypothetical protein